MEQELRSMLKRHLTGGEAFVPLHKAVEGLDWKQVDKKPDKMSHNIWQLAFHLYYSAKDITDYVSDENYEAGVWPDDYWPESERPESEAEWNDIVRKMLGEIKRMQALVSDDGVDLFRQIPWGKEGHNVYRGAMLVIEHNAYHTGQIIDVRKALGLWN